MYPGRKSKRKLFSFVEKKRKQKNLSESIKKDRDKRSKINGKEKKESLYSRSPNLKSGKNTTQGNWKTLEINKSERFLLIHFFRLFFRGLFLPPNEITTKIPAKKCHSVTIKKKKKTKFGTMSKKHRYESIKYLVHYPENENRRFSSLFSQTQ